MDTPDSVPYFPAIASLLLKEPMNLGTEASPVIPGQAAINNDYLDAWRELKLKLQADVYKISIRLQDFLSPFDRHLRGSVIEPNFERALAAAGITLTAEDMKVVRSQFGIIEKSQPLIAYHPFLNAINTVFGPLNLEQNPDQVVIDGQRLTADYEHKIALSLRQPDRLLPPEISLLKHSIQRIRDRIFKLRFDPSSRFRDFDKFNSGSVSKVQFHKCLTAAGFNFSDEIINLLSRQYASGRHIDHVDYRKFLYDVTQESVDNESSTFKQTKTGRSPTYIKAEKPSPLTLESILLKMRNATSGYSIRFFDYLRDADPLRKNAITKSRLAAVLSSIGDINLSDEETALLQQVFPHDVERDQINYQKMADSIQDGFVLKNMKNHPGLSPAGTGNHQTLANCH